MTEVKTCPNCGVTKTAVFCGVCGQNDRDYQQPFWSIVGDATSELFEFDGRVLRSLQTIIVRPGQLSVEFESNRRAGFISPIRAFLFTSFIWVIAFSFALQQETPDANSEQSQRSGSEAPGAFIGDLDLESAALVEGLNELREHLRGPRVSQFDMVVSQSDEARKRWFLLVAEIYQSDLELPNWIASAIANVAYELTFSPNNFKNTLIENFPVTMFVLLPWYTLLLLMFFSRGGKRLIHHVVFALHVHVFAFMVFTILHLLPAPPKGLESTWQWYHHATQNLSVLLVLGFHVHTYLAFKRFFANGYVKTLFKYLALNLLYGIGVAPALLAVVGFTLWGYA